MRLLGKISIRARLIVLCAVLSAFLVAAGAAGIWALSATTGDMQLGLNQDVLIGDSIDAARRVQVEFKKQVQEWKNILIRGNDREKYDKYYGRFKKQEAVVQEDFKRLMGMLAQLGVDASLVEKARAAHLDLGEKYRAALESFDQDDPLTGKKVDKLVSGIDRAPTDAIDEIVEFIKAEGERLAEDTLQAAPRDLEKYSRIGIVAMIVLLAVSGILSVAIFRSIVSPLKSGAAFAASVAGGDLSREFDVNQKGEMAEMAQGLNSIARTLRTISTEVNRVSDRVIQGHLLDRCDTSKAEGDFAGLLGDINGLAQGLTDCLDKVPTPIMTFSKDFDILYMNQAGLNVADNTLEKLKGKKCYEVFKTSDCRTERCASARAMASSREESSETDAHPGGRDMEISYSANALKDKDDQVAGVIEVIVDLTQFKQVQQKIVKTAEQAVEISEMLSSAAEELSAQVEQSSQGARSQNDRTGEMATAMEEVNATVMEVAQNASSAAENTENAKQKAQEGAATVGELIKGINQVQSMSETLRGNMSDLGEQVEGIGRIMNVITDIADQTNLLALNAAIEAARAGDAGRGFAVVADEVRKLAEKTMAATKEVGNAIGSIQESTRNNVTETEKAAEAVGQITELANRSGAALQEIVSVSDSAADQVRAIATASEEQSSAMEQISRSTEEVNRIASETADAMTQAEAAINELSGLAHKLKALIDELQD